MLWVLVLLALGFTGWLILRKKPKRHLPLGRWVGRSVWVIDGVCYTVEEVAFDDYQAAIHGYFRLVPIVLALGKVCEERYDFFDFYSVAVRFENHSARLLRLVDRVRLVQSDRAMDLDEFERQIPSFAYQPLNQSRLNFA